MQPDLEAFVGQYSHKTGVCYYASDNFDPIASLPIFFQTARHTQETVRPQTGPAYLLEIHSLKPNKQRSRVLRLFVWTYYHRWSEDRLIAMPRLQLIKRVMMVIAL
jgi:hypothetical protein